MKNLTFILFIFAVLLTINLVSADSYGIYKVNDRVDVDIPCSISGSWCSSGAVCNITTFYPNTTILVSNQKMTNNLSYHNYTFIPGQLSNLGDYKNQVVCNDGSFNGSTTFIFTINPSGTDLSTGQGMIYVVVFVVSIFLFMLSSFVGINLPYSNNRNEEGRISGINYNKYFKVILFFISYLLLIWVFFLGWNISYSFLFLGFTTTFFQVIYVTLIGGIFPAFICLFVFTIIIALQDKKLYNKLRRGFHPR